MNIKKTLSLLALAIICQNPGSAAPVKSDFDEGVKQYQAKNYVGAKEAFDKVIKATPSSWQAQYYLANTYLALGQLPQAKYCYQVCMHYCKDSATQAQCQAGIDQIAKLAEPKAPAPAAPMSGTSSKSADKKSSDSDSDDDDDKNLSPAMAQLAKQKERVMEEARKETGRIHKEAKEQIEAEKAASNQIYKYGDGHRGLDISTDRVNEILKEADEKCAQVMKNAEIRCRGFH